MSAPRIDMTTRDSEHAKRLREAVSQVWDQSILTMFEASEDGQRKLIAFQRQSYVYPDYLSLVGEPSANDYTADGELTLARKSRLLLIGVFQWKGLALAKHPGVSLRGKRQEELWAGEMDGWYVLDTNQEEPADPVECLFFPYNGRGAVPLGVYLIKHRESFADDEKLFYVDDNIYNCAPDNLQKRKKYGRPMRCTLCRRRVTPEMSTRIKHDGRYQRFCFSCIKEFGEPPE